MKFSYWKIFLLGFGFFGVSVIWAVYNAYVPVYLSEKFGLSTAVVGFFMSLDNIAALFIQPPVGAWSDRMRTRLGRRLPFILVGAPISAVAFGLIPLAAVLPLFVACTTTLLLSMALWRTPVVALMPDITPSQKRSQANGIINFMGGLGAIIAFLGGATLYEMNHAFPFWLGSILVILSAILVLLFIREPKDIADSEKPEQPFAGFGKYLLTQKIWGGLLLAALVVVYFLTRNLLLLFVIAFAVFVLFYTLFMAREPIHDKDKSAIRILLAIFFWFVGYAAIEAFFTLYSINHLGLEASDGSRLLGQLSLFFVLFALVSGFIGAKIGRKLTISIGLVMMIMVLLGIFLLPVSTLTTVVTTLPVLKTVPVIGLFLMVAGIAWALININSLPMVVDMTTAARIGTFTGLYYLFSTLSAIVGPNLNGWIIQLSGNNFNLVMAVGALFMFVALVLMLGVKRGEANPTEV
jgi:maltose/moltooligosaccharide transporter